jgi:hypothetical protein
VTLDNSQRHKASHSQRLQSHRAAHDARMQKEFWYHCPKCDHVWFRHHSVPFLRVPLLTRFPTSCPKCEKRNITPYMEEEKTERLLSS